MNSELSDSLRNLKKQLPIDKYQLDDVIVEQPILLSDAGYLLSRISSAKDAAKSKSDNLYAEISNQVRRQASLHEGRYQGLKLTEARIDSEVKLDPRYIEVLNSYNDLKMLESQATTIKESFEARGRMIKLLVDLYLAEYWSTTAPSRSSEQTLQKMNEHEVESIRKAQAERRSRPNNS